MKTLTAYDVQNGVRNSKKSCLHIKKESISFANDNSFINKEQTKEHTTTKSGINNDQITNNQSRQSLSFNKDKGLK